jgi:hypothetical protein
MTHEQYEAFAERLQKLWTSHDQESHRVFRRELRTANPSVEQLQELRACKPLKLTGPSKGVADEVAHFIDSLIAEKMRPTEVPLSVISRDEEIELAILRTFTEHHKTVTLNQGPDPHHCALELDMRDVVRALTQRDGPELEYDAQFWLDRLAPLGYPPPGMLRRCSDRRARSGAHRYNARAWRDPVNHRPSPNAWERIHDLELRHESPHESRAATIQGEEGLSPKPPRLLQELKWLVVHGRRHWKYVVLAGLVIVAGWCGRGSFRGPVDQTQGRPPVEADATGGENLRELLRERIQAIVALAVEYRDPPTSPAERQRLGDKLITAIRDLNAIPNDSPDLDTALRIEKYYHGTLGLAMAAVLSLEGAELSINTEVLFAKADRAAQGTLYLINAVADSAQASRQTGWQRLLSELNENITRDKTLYCLGLAIAFKLETLPPSASGERAKLLLELEEVWNQIEHESVKDPPLEDVLQRALEAIGGSE